MMRSSIEDVTGGDLRSQDNQLQARNSDKLVDNYSGFRATFTQNDANYSEINHKNDPNFATDITSFEASIFDNYRNEKRSPQH